MKQIYSLSQPQILSEDKNIHEFKFTAPQRANYLIIVQAKSKNWWQNKSKWFDDDDLSIKIDGSKLPKIDLL